MNFTQRLNRFLAALEWRWSLSGIVWGTIFPASSFVLPAWATRAAGMFSDSAPISWVAAGFLGVLFYTISVALYGFGQSRIVQSRYNAKFMAVTGGADPLAKVFESKRIFLNDFVIPSNPLIDGKTFVDCEIVGPANLYLEVNNNINDVKPNVVDAVALSGDRYFTNGFAVRNCAFRNCTFHKITLFVKKEEVWGTQHLNWLNWISPLPSQEMLPEFEASEPNHEEPKDTESE